ncbi:hypothetical protein VC83_03324 [Pseudogymnoascus destructans]|uniref:WW domain-containing protein n=1 Tax=Pseudogymnoascus destructans TaxID=655981 RepID=A0A177AGW2_9PEZI|nr:uncharacterized protein VC83_03324 [Pseudogymnoascus destructans]OAF60501.1 hypothetical protein VC83_03324 [Pseudogymnoascus destructans]
MSTSGYPPGWEADYDGETERWFYTHNPAGVRQYHFPKAGDEVELAAAMSRSKAANKAKSKESNTARSLKDLATTKVTPGTKSQALDQSQLSGVQYQSVPRQHRHNQYPTFSGRASKLLRELMQLRPSSYLTNKPPDGASSIEYAGARHIKNSHSSCQLCSPVTH